MVNKKEKEDTPLFNPQPVEIKKTGFPITNTNTNKFDKLYHTTKKLNKTVIKGVRIDIASVEIIDTYCQLTGVTFSSLVQNFVDEFIQNMPQDILNEVVELINKKKKIREKPE
ncbi:MAG: hypothetical protein QXG00_06110 [Candidatus Woesearchaeota archaeon]